MEAFLVNNAFIAKPFQVLPSPWTVYGRAIANMKVIQNNTRANPTQAIFTRVSGFGVKR